MYKNIIDMHTHSDNSFDGNHSCVLLCEGAIVNKGRGIAITDHADMDAKDYDFRAFSLNQYVESYAAKKAFEGKLLVMQGLEIGQGIYEKEKTLELLGSYNYDFILGSIHNLKDMEDFFFMDYTKVDVDEILKQYFLSVLELAEWDKTDSIAHLTYPLRYITGKYSIPVDISKYQDIIDAIFETIINNEKALELNISGLYGELGDTMPSKDMIKRFYDMGGEYVTVGSDSHSYNKVCIGIDKGYDILLECGFKQYTIFKNREPILIDIE